MARTFLRRTFSLKTGIRLLVAGALLVAGIVVTKSLWDRRAFQGYEADLPLEARILARGEIEGFRTEKIEITGLNGERIPLRLVLPDRAVAPYRCVVFLYGIGQNMRFFEKIASIFALQGVAMAMPEQYHCGERKRRGISLSQEALAFRERASRLVPETRRVLDYLLSRGDMDPGRMDFLGASYGAIMGCAVLAHEPRFHCGALVMAGGNFRKLLGFMARRHKPEWKALLPVAAELGAWYISPFEPLRFVGQVTPRPLLFLNVKADELIDPECVAELYEAAGEPKEEIWYAGAHNSISEKTVQLMMKDALAWMRRVNP